ncbi:MAG: oligosaccharide flippase family protein [Caldilineales bacterium]|nr:oligosaccharide flippase family protein [Caldilineales bacterium]
MTSDAREMSRSLSLISINKGIQVIGGMLWALIVPRWLGPDAYGQLALAMSISLLLWWVGDFGGLEIFGRYIPRLQERDPNSARKLVGQFFSLRVLVALPLPFLMLAIGPLIAPYLAGWPSFFIGVAAGIHIISWTSYHLLYARKEMGKWSVELSWRLFTQLPLILLVGAYGLGAQMASYSLNELLFLILAIVWTRTWLRRKDMRIDRKFVSPYFRFGLGFWATNIGIIILFRSGTILVQLLTGNPAQVSYFDLALVVFFLVQTIIDQLMRSFLPTVSEFKEGGQHERVGVWLQAVTQWGAALAIAAVIGVQYTAVWIMPFILGADFQEAAMVLRVMLLALPALVVVGVGTLATAVHESARAKLIALAAGIAVFYGSSYFLIESIGAIGAAWALTSGLTVYALVLFAQIRNDLQLRWPALLGLFALGFPFVLLQPFVADHRVLAFGSAIVAALLYLLAGYLLKLLPPTPLQLIPHLVGRPPKT